MADEQRFVSPLQRYVGSLRDVCQFDLYFGKCQHIGGGAHAHHVLPYTRLSTVSRGNQAACVGDKEEHATTRCFKGLWIQLSITLFAEDKFK